MDVFSTDYTFHILIELKQILRRRYLSVSTYRTEIRNRLLYSYEEYKIPQPNERISERCKLQSSALFNVGGMYVIGKYLSKMSPTCSEQDMQNAVDLLTRRFYQELLCAASQAVFEEKRQPCSVFQVINTTRIYKTEDVFSNYIVRRLRNQEDVLLFLQLTLEYDLFSQVYSSDLFTSIQHVIDLMGIALNVQYISLTVWNETVKQLEELNN